MKKTLHGKRYIRSRHTVVDGRDKRKIHKFNRAFTIFSKIDWKNLNKTTEKAIAQAREITVDISYFPTKKERPNQ